MCVSHYIYTMCIYIYVIYTWYQTELLAPLLRRNVLLAGRHFDDKCCSLLRSGSGASVFLDRNCPFSIDAN